MPPALSGATVAPEPGGGMTEAHRRGQVRIAADAAREIRESWLGVSPTDLEPTSRSWLARAIPLVRGFRRRSRRLSGAYLRLLRGQRTGRTLPPLDPGPDRREVRLGELREEFYRLAGEPRPRPRDDDTVRVTVDDFEWPDGDEEGDDRAATVSLIVTGPVRAQDGITRVQGAAERGRLDAAAVLAELDTVMRDAGATAAAAADREAQRGGRDLIASYAAADRAVVGWARVTDGDPCWFCAMLASRGAVYRSQWRARYTGQTRRGARRPDRMPDGWQDWPPERLAEWEAEQGLNRFHDNCHCTLVPVYSRDGWVPETSAEWRRLYTDSTRGLAGPDARAAFRRAIEERRRQQRAA